jgi:DNA-binding GntR family transcriptional regulator
MRTKRGVAAFTLTEQVHRNLKRRIITHDLKPGSRLVVSRLSQELGTSLTPVREALRLLQRDDLVKIVPHKGAIVRKLSRKEFEDIFAVRKSLETLAIKMACPCLNPGDIARLEGIVQSSKSIVQSEDVEAWTDLDERFHKGIIQKCGNEFLKDTLAGIFDQVRVLWWLAGDLPGQMEKGLKSHESILSALRAGDAGQAQHLIKAHIETAEFREFS